MNFLAYIIFAIFTANIVDADYLQCYVCEDCEENDGYLEYCPPLEDMDLMPTTTHGTTATSDEIDLTTQGVSITTITTAAMHPADDTTMTTPTENTIAPAGPTSIPITQTTATTTTSMNSNETNYLTAMLSSNTTAKPTTTATTGLELETIAQIDDAPLSTQIFPETNGTDDIFGNITNLDPEFYRPTVNSTADLNSTDMSKLPVTQTTNNESTTVLSDLSELNGLTTYPQGVIKPVINNAEAINMSISDLASFESVTDILNNKTSNSNADALTALSNAGEGKPTNTNIGDDETLTDSKELDFNVANSTLIAGLEDQISTEIVENSFMKPVEAPAANIGTAFANETNREPENTTLELDLVVKNSTIPETAKENATVSLELAGVLGNVTSFVRPNSTAQADLFSQLFGNITTSLEQSLGTPSENNPSIGNNLTNLEPDLLENANDALENITVGVEPSDIIHNVSAFEGIENLIVSEGLNATGIQLDPAMETAMNLRPLSPINSTSSLNNPTNVGGLLEPMKPQSGLLENSLPGSKLRRSTTTNVKQVSSQLRGHNPSHIPHLMSKQRSSRLAAQIQRGNITFKCYTVRVRGQNKTQLNKGCLAVPAESAPLGVLVKKYGLEALEDYQVCSHNKCNRSSSGGLRITVKIMIFIMFVGWLFD